MARTRQPQGPTRIDWNNPLTRGLVFATIGSNATNIASSVLLSGSAGITVSSKGLSKTFNGSSQRVYVPHTVTPAAFTLFGLAKCTNQTATNTLISLGAANAGFMMLDFSGTEGDDPLRLYVYDGSALKQTYSFNPIYNEYAAFCGVVPPVGGTLVTYQNGVQRAHESGSNTGYAFNSVVDIAVGAVTTGGSPSNYFNGEVAVALAWYRDLSAVEVKAVSDNPWQLFSSPRRLWVQVGAASGGAGVTLAPSKGALTLTGYVPAIAQPRVVAPTVGHITLTGKTPGIEQDKAVAPAKGALTLTGYVPTLTQPRTIAAVKGTLTLTGYTPSIQQSASGTIAPSKGALTLTGYAPGLEQDRNVAPAKGALVVTGGQPGIIQNVTTFIAPSKGSLTATGYAPSVGSTANQTVAPSTGTLTLAGYVPVLAQTGAQTIGPIKGALTLAGYAPTVQVIGAGVTIVEPAAGALTLSGYAPLIGLILAADALDSSRLIDRDPARLGSSRIGPPVVNREDYPFGTPTPPQRRPRLG